MTPGKGEDTSPGWWVGLRTDANATGGFLKLPRWNLPQEAAGMNDSPSQEVLSSWSLVRCTSVDQSLRWPGSFVLLFVLCC